MSTSRLLRNRLTAGPVLMVPGAADAITARIIEDLGYEAVYVTGAGIANSYLGAPDVGLVTFSELLAHVAAIRDAVAIPMIVDIDTGFGNAINVTRTVRELTRVGANALQIEDQISPKKCGHFSGKRVITAGEMAQKIRAATDARVDDAALIIARTDARSIEGFESAIERAQTYREAGADVTFVEAPETADELLSVPYRIDAPQVVNLVEGGRTPLLPIDQLKDFRIALYANVALQAAAYGVQKVLGTLKSSGSLEDVLPEIVGWEERQRLVRKPTFDSMEANYAADG